MPAWFNPLRSQTWEHYLDETTYRELIEALARVAGANEIKIILGEIGNIWPESICAENPPAHRIAN